METKTLEWDIQGYGRQRHSFTDQKRGFCDSCYDACLEYCRKNKLRQTQTNICGIESLPKPKKVHLTSSASSSSGPTVGQSSGAEERKPVWVTVKRQLRHAKMKFRHRLLKARLANRAQDTVPDSDDSAADDESDERQPTRSPSPRNVSSTNPSSVPTQHHVHHHFVHLIAPINVPGTSSSSGINFGDFAPGQLSSYVPSDVVDAFSAYPM